MKISGFPEIPHATVPKFYKQQLLWMAVTDFLLILNPNVSK